MLVAAVLKAIELRGTIAYVRDYRATSSWCRTAGSNWRRSSPAASLDDLITEGVDTLINHNESAVTIIVHP